MPRFKRKLTAPVPALGAYKAFLRVHFVSYLKRKQKRMKPIELRFVQRIALAALVAIMVACSWLTPLDSAANQQVDAGLKRALLSFATARALNAVISVVQGT